MTLKQLIESEGYTVEYHPNPQNHVDAVGFPTQCPHIQCQLLTDKRIATSDFSWDAAYSASHEISEERFGFEHSADMFCEQANILARWIKKLAVSNEAFSIPQYGSRSSDS